MREGTERYKIIKRTRGGRLPGPKDIPDSVAQAGATAAEAMALTDSLTVGVPLTPAVQRALPELVEQVQDQAERWHNEPS